MKKFLINTSLILAVFYAIFYFILWLTPFYWANEGFSAKMSYWGKNKESFNTVFIGSSRTQMHIMPSVFDSINKDCNIRSLNLGYGSNSAEEIIHFTEKLIESDYSKNLNFIFVEIRPIWYSPGNLFTARDKSFLNYEEFKFLTEYYSKTKYTYASSDYRKAYLEKILGIGIIRDLFLYYFKEKKDYLLGENNDGFLNRTDAIKKDDLNKLIKENGENIEQSIGIIQKKAEFIISSYKNFNEISNEDLIYVQRLKNLILLANKKGINLNYYPTLGFENTNIPAIINSVEKGSVFFQTSNPEFYPEFYSLKYLGDVSHLSEEGAVLYSNLLANKFRERNCR